jgi:hypothetical protein
MTFAEDMRPGSFIQTVSGRRIDPFDPDADAIDITDIAYALSNQCRFGGHCRESSVAWDWPELDGIEPLELEIRAWRPARARRELLDRYRRLDRRRPST